jgi:two-component system response regulator
MKYSKIIIADDDIDDRNLIEKGFAELGIKDILWFASDGEDLLRLLNSKKSDVGSSIIFLDLNMPRMDGRQVLKQIKQNNEFKKIPIIIFTTSKSREDVESTYEIGANCFIIKPNTFPNLVKTLKKTIHFWLETATLPSTI